jgi:hypothetical protein
MEGNLLTRTERPTQCGGDQGLASDADPELEVKSPTWYLLHSDFVAAARVAHRADWDTNNVTRLCRWGKSYEEILSLPSRVVAREHSPESRRLQRLADAIGYDGPILGEVAACMRGGVQP